MLGRVFIISLFSIVLLPVQVPATPGDLDISFNPLDGYATYDAGTAGHSPSWRRR